MFIKMATEALICIRTYNIDDVITWVYIIMLGDVVLFPLS